LHILELLILLNNLFINLIVIEARACHRSASEFGSFSLTPTKNHLAVAYVAVLQLTFVIDMTTLVIN